jgi:tape measure domain-containing protein
MATVSASLRMFDHMTRPLQQVTQALNITISAMDQMNNSANRDVRITNSLNTARESIRRAGTGLQELATEQDRARNNQDRLNDSFNRGSNSANGLIAKVKGLVGTYLGLKAVKAGMDSTDNYINQNARLALINDKTQTQAELQNKIYQAAQRSRGEYGATLNTVAKLGLLAKDAFKGNDEAIAFAELMNKSFKISGASTSEASNGMYQLTQAMASGRLQGDEFRSIMENAPMLAQAIAKYAGKSMGELREMSKEGEISSQLIKNALFSAADDINKKFETMPMTFGTVWTSIKNKAVMEFSTIMQKVNNFIKSDVGASAIKNISNSVTILAYTLGGIIDTVIAVSTFFHNNWGIIAPIVFGIVAALVVYKGTMLACAIATGISSFANALYAVGAYNACASLAATELAIWGKISAQTLEAMVTASATAAQYGLNAALLACPIVWIIIAIIALIVVVYAVVGAINHFEGRSISATGVIMGAFMAAAAFIGNLIVAAINIVIDCFVIIWNFIASFAEFFANVLNDPVGSIVRLFSSMADSVLEILEGIASAVDTLFSSNLAGAVSGWRSSLQGMTNDLVGESKIKVERIDSSKMHLERFNYGDAYDSGYKVGKNVEQKFKIPNLDDMLKKAKGNGKGMDPWKYSGVDDTNKHVKNIDDKIDISNEHLEMMRDLAEQESIQNFVTLTPTVQVTTGDIKEEADINKIISKIETYMENELARTAEGVYA